ncbi:MAG: hypothetical protein R2867_12050 [Caldilineaceae bacterium]
MIDIQGDGFPYLDWYQERIRGAWMSPLAFPLGDPEFTMTRIVARARRWRTMGVVDRVIPT